MPQHCIALAMIVVHFRYDRISNNGILVSSVHGSKNVTYVVILPPGKGSTHTLTRAEKKQSEQQSNLSNLGAMNS
jgi:hypothetical protein